MRNVNTKTSYETLITAQTIDFFMPGTQHDRIN